MLTPDPSPKNTGSRRHPRQKLRGLSTPFGQLLDISASGACVFRKGDATVEIGDQTTLIIDHEGLQLNLNCQVIRTQPLGLRRLEIGLEFIAPTDADREVIQQLIARTGTDFSPSAWLAA